ncbi:MAG: CRTAC1 family protein [Rhodothermia bacterium]|nr:CRTAC1 family protein [Rhodothermia bacterium]
MDSNLVAAEKTDWFREVQDERGIDFVHRHGGTGNKYFMETMGSGAGLFDYDNDGWLDAYLVQSGPIPTSPNADRGIAATLDMGNRLYRNVGGGRFVDATQSSGTGDANYGMGVAFGDYDNDGFVDIYVTNFGPDKLYRNDGDGTFSDVTSPSGLGDTRWGAGAAFADFDLDGDLDLYVVNYITYSIDRNIRCGPADILAYCHPDVYPGSPDILYRNDGGKFTDVSRLAGVHVDDPDESKGLGVVWVDYDNDGDPDIYVTNDSTPNFLYRNNGDGSFTNVALEAGVAYNRFGKTEAGMGIDFGDYDWNGHADLFMTHLDEETNTLYHSFGGGLFQDYSSQSRLGPASLKNVGFGVGIFDFDADGWLDVFVANGHIIEAIERIRPGSGVTYAQRNQLFRNESGRTFRDISSSAGPHFQKARVGRGAAFGDIDNDGDTDILISNSNQEAVLLENVIGGSADWIGLRLVGSSANRDALGARVLVSAEGRTRWREVHGGGSYLSQSDRRLSFGLPGGTRPDSVVVQWPGGSRQRLGRDLATGTYHTIIERE